MKRKILTVLLLTCLTLSACGTTGKTSSDAGETDAATEDSADKSSLSEEEIFQPERTDLSYLKPQQAFDPAGDFNPSATWVKITAQDKLTFLHGYESNPEASFNFKSQMSDHYVEFTNNSGIKATFRFQSEMEWLGEFGTISDGNTVVFATKDSNGSNQEVLYFELEDIASSGKQLKDMTIDEIRQKYQYYTGEFYTNNDEVEDYYLFEGEQTYGALYRAGTEITGNWVEGFIYVYDDYERGVRLYAREFPQEATDPHNFPEIVELMKSIQFTDLPYNAGSVTFSNTDNTLTSHSPIAAEPGMSYNLTQFIGTDPRSVLFTWKADESLCEYLTIDPQTSIICDEKADRCLRFSYLPKSEEKADYQNYSQNTTIEQWTALLDEGVAYDDSGRFDYEDNGRRIRVAFPVTVTQNGETYRGYQIFIIYSGGLSWPVYKLTYYEKEALYDDARALDVINSINGAYIPQDNDCKIPWALWINNMQ